MAWHTITALGQHTRSDYVRSGMTSPPLDRTHSRTTSGVACHHRLWTTHMVERRRAWHAFRLHIRSDDIGRGMTSSPLGGTHGRTMSGMARHHRLWTAHTVERRWAWHAIIAFGQHTRSNDVGRGIPSSPLDNTHGRQRRAWHAITALGMPKQSATLSVA